MPLMLAGTSLSGRPKIILLLGVAGSSKSSRLSPPPSSNSDAEDIDPGEVGDKPGVLDATDSAIGSFMKYAVNCRAKSGIECPGARNIGRLILLYDRLVDCVSDGRSQFDVLGRNGSSRSGRSIGALSRSRGLLMARSRCGAGMGSVCGCMSCSGTEDMRLPGEGIGSCCCCCCEKEKLSGTDEMRLLCLQVMGRFLGQSGIGGGEPGDRSRHGGRDSRRRCFGDSNRSIAFATSMLFSAELLISRRSSWSSFSSRPCTRSYKWSIDGRDRWLVAGGILKVATSRRAMD